MTKGYTTDFYKQFEEISNKLDNILSENKKLKTTYKKETQKLKNEFKQEKNELKETIIDLQTIIKEKDETIKKLLDEIDRLKNQINKNSTNSSKPSSTNIVTPKKKTGANLYNSRIKSDKLVGGQIGHKGHNLSKEKIEQLIKDNKVESEVIEHTIKGNKQVPTIKYKIGIKIKPYVEKHIFNYDKNSNDKLPKELQSDVTYDNSIKALSIELGTYNVISYDRLSDFFSVITNNVINISTGTLVKFLYEFSDKSKLTIETLEEDILDGTIIKTDETSCKYNKENMYVRNYSNNQTVIYKSHKNKGHKPIKEDNILPRFCGGIMGDHDTTLYSYGNKNYECNIHLGRYLEELIQNVNITWPKKMKELIFETKNKRDKLIKSNKDCFSKEKIEQIIKEYENILNLAKEENKNINSSFYKDKSEKLYRRLIKYKENYLYFIKDFNVPFDNNSSEQDLRIFKIKTKVSGGFRSMNGSNSYVDALSIIKTSIKRGINPFESIKSIFNNQVLFQIKRAII